MKTILDLSAVPRFLLHEQEYTMPEDPNLAPFYVTEIIPNPNGKKAPVPVEFVEDMLRDMAEGDGTQLRYAVLYNPTTGMGEPPLTTGWDALSQPLQPNLATIRKTWHKDFMVIMTFEPIAQDISNLVSGQVVSPKHI